MRPIAFEGDEVPVPGARKDLAGGGGCDPLPSPL